MERKKLILKFWVDFDGYLDSLVFHLLLLFQLILADLAVNVTIIVVAFHSSFLILILFPCDYFPAGCVLALLEPRDLIFILQIFFILFSCVCPSRKGLIVPLLDLNAICFLSHHLSLSFWFFSQTSCLKSSLLWVLWLHFCF